MAHILLIEPDRVLAETYAACLTAGGHRVIACAGAQAAIMAADQHRPDLVILEFQLVGHSGVEFLYEFRSYTEWQDIPVLVQTSVPLAEFSGNEQILRHELKLAAYLYKPQTSLRQLLSAVDEHLPVAA